MKVLQKLHNLIINSRNGGVIFSRKYDDADADADDDADDDLQCRMYRDKMPRARQQCEAKWPQHSLNTCLHALNDRV